MVLATWWGWSDAGNIVLSVALAFAFGYALTILALQRAGLSARAALPLALVSDTLSTVTMEIIDSLIVLAIPGALAAGLGDAVFWGSLALALFIAFWAAVPVNRRLIARGKGHAVVRAHHAH